MCFCVVSLIKKWRALQENRREGSCWEGGWEECWDGRIALGWEGRWVERSKLGRKLGERSKLGRKLGERTGKTLGGPHSWDGSWHKRLLFVILGRKLGERGKFPTGDLALGEALGENVSENCPYPWEKLGRTRFSQRLSQLFPHSALSKRLPSPPSA